jgi:hypothetical protein
MPSQIRDGHSCRRRCNGHAQRHIGTSGVPALAAGPKPNPAGTAAELEQIDLQAEGLENFARKLAVHPRHSASRDRAAHSTLKGWADERELTYAA